MERDNTRWAAAVAWAIEDEPRSLSDVIDRVGGWDDPQGVRDALEAWRTLGVVRCDGRARTARWSLEVTP